MSRIGMIALAGLSLCVATAAAAKKDLTTVNVVVNQVGYLPADEKIALDQFLLSSRRRARSTLGGLPVAR